jgi:arsenate reductase
LKLIQDAGVDPDIVDYLKSPPSQSEIDRILKLLDMNPGELMRKQEAVYKELGIANGTHSRRELIKILVENPVLMERPIVVTESQAVIGRPPENVNELLP